MKIPQNEKLLGLNPKQQNYATIIMLAIIAGFCFWIWIISQMERDSITGAIGVAFMILSSICLIAAIMEKYEVSMALSSIGALFSAILLLAIISWFFEEPEPHVPDPVFYPDLLIFLLPVILFSITSMFLWNLSKQPKVQFYPYYSYSPATKKETGYSIASILIGVLGLVVVTDVIPLGLAIGIISIILGLKALRKKDRSGLAGILIGSIIIVYSAAWGIAYSAGLT